MIAVDTNVLVHAHRRDASENARAGPLIRELAESGRRWAIPWPCVHEFIGVVTHPRVFPYPASVSTAVEQVDAWLESPGLSLIAETGATWPLVRSTLVDGRTVGPRVHDAKIAAICLAHGVTELWTADRDFSRFPGLRTRNPLVST